MSATEAQRAPLAGGRLSLARCALRVLSGDQKGQERVLEGDVLRIGKADGNDLVLRDASVSREHCEIVRDPKGYLLRDLGSTNGTQLDGTEVREGYLRAGAVISIGRIELSVRTYDERIEIAPSEHERFGELVGRDPQLRSVFGLLERIAPTDATLLIAGETGTGKDALARSVHAASKRSAATFFSVDCGALVGSLIESELFGHEKGAFTGAVDRRKGAFELAHGGTLFLDEIGELPLELQPKLLRVLETRRVRRVGGNQEIAVDIRVIAASNRNLELEVERGKFRQDLYFRLAVVPIWLPPLRARRTDIGLLARQLLVRICKEHGSGKALELTETMLQGLAGHDWPGNVRELRNVLERAALLAYAQGSAQLSAVPLALTSLGPPRPQAAPAAASNPEPAPAFDPEASYGATRAQWEADFERRYVSWLLARHDGNISAAARAAEMDRKHLHKLAQKHGLK